MLEAVATEVEKALLDLGLLAESKKFAFERIETAIEKSIVDARNVLEIVHFIRGQYPHIFGATGGTLVSDTPKLPPKQNPRDKGKAPSKTATTVIPIAPKGDNTIETPPADAPKTDTVTPPVAPPALTAAPK